MYACGGTAYVYLCYGIHSLFNVVTNVEDVPHAVLIRGIIPADGIKTMVQRAGKIKETRDLGMGPGKVSKILGIHFSHSGLDLVNMPENKDTPSIWIADSAYTLNPGAIKSGARIGVGYAGEDALLPYRFFVGDIEELFRNPL
jgi:DNA-3-methyladenine glycosylase